MKTDEFDDKRIDEAADALLRYALEIVAREQPVSPEEIQACLAIDTPQTPEDEAIARRLLTPENLQRIVSRALADKPSESPSIERLVERLREMKPLPTEEAADVTHEQKAKGMLTDFHSRAVAFAKELTNELRTQCLQLFANRNTMHAAGEDKPLLRFATPDGRIKGRMDEEPNGDYTIRLESQHLELAGKRFTIRFRRPPAPTVILEHMDERTVFGKVTIPREFVPEEICDLKVEFDEV